MTTITEKGEIIEYNVLIEGKADIPFKFWFRLLFLFKRKLYFRVLIYVKDTDRGLETVHTEAEVSSDE